MGAGDGGVGVVSLTRGAGSLAVGAGAVTGALDPGGDDVAGDQKTAGNLLELWWEPLVADRRCCGISHGGTGIGSVGGSSGIGANH